MEDIWITTIFRQSDAVGQEIDTEYDYLQRLQTNKLLNEA